MSISKARARTRAHLPARPAQPVKLPYPTVEALRAAYAFTDLQSFLDIYYAGASVLLTEEDFFDMTMDYVRRAVADNVRHAEIFFDPQTHTARGVPVSTVIDGIADALARARTEYDFSSSLILCFLRHLSEEDAFATLEAALPFRDRFVGIGRTRPSAATRPKFARVFARARDWACTGGACRRGGARPTTCATRSTCSRWSASTTVCAPSTTPRWSSASRASACR